MNKNHRTSIISTIATASVLAVVLAYLASNHDMTLFKETIESDLRYRDIVFRRQDCTENGPMLDAARKWFSQQHADDSLMTTGYGAMAWIRSGRVVDTVHDAAKEGVDKLVTKTRMTM